MVPGALDIAYTRGDDYTLRLEFKDADTNAQLDWSTMSFSAQLRKFEDDVLAATFTVDDTDSDTGVVLLTLTAAETADLGRAYAWDFERVDTDGQVLTVLAGTATVKLDVTRQEGS